MKLGIFKPQQQDDSIQVVLGNVTKNFNKVKIPSNPSLSFTYVALNDHPDFVEEGAKLIADKIQALGITNPYFVTPEASTISLAHVLRTKYQIDGTILYKKARVDDVNPISVSYFAVTSTTENKLFLDVNKAKLFQNKTIVFIDSIVTTGETLKAIHSLLTKAGIKQESIHSAIVLFTEDTPRKEIDISDQVKLPVHSFNHLEIYQNSSNNVADC